MNFLVPCPECHRHVRVSEASCPFCRAALANNADRLSPDTSRRLGRAAAFVFGATVAITACGGDTVVVDDDEDPTTTSTSTTSTGGDGGGMQTLYGGPAVGGGGMGGGDVGGAAPGGMDPSGTGGFMAEYGAPPPPED